MVKSTGRGAGGKTPAAELEKILTNLGVAQTRAARDLGMQPATFKNLLSGKKKFEIETCLLVAKYTSTSPDFWIELQRKTGLAEAKANTKLQNQLRDLKKPIPTAALRGGSAKKGAANKPPVKKGGAKSAVKKPVRKPASSNNGESGIWSTTSV